MVTQDPTLEALRRATARIEARLDRLEGRSRRLRTLVVGAGLVAGVLLVAFATARAAPPAGAAPARRARFAATTVPAVFHR